MALWHAQEAPRESLAARAGKFIDSTIVNWRVITQKLLFINTALMSYWRHI